MPTSALVSPTLPRLSSHPHSSKPTRAPLTHPPTPHSESSTGNPLASQNRQPEPASRPEKFTVPSSKASDVAQNPYFKRDFRRMYPKTEVVTQGELAKLLIAQGGFEACVPLALRPLLGGSAADLD